MQRFDDWRQWLDEQAAAHPLRTALSVSLLLVLGTLLTLNVQYAANDDIVMAMIVSGQYVAEQPSDELVFTNVLIGRCLRDLYTQWPTIPWYFVYLASAHLLAHAALLYAVLLRGGSARRIGLYVLFYATVGLYLLLYVQFTTTAFLVTFAGAVLAIVWFEAARSVDWRSDATAAAVAVGLMVFGSLIRYPAFQMGVVAALPLLLVRPVLASVAPCLSSPLPAQPSLLSLARDWRTFWKSMWWKSMRWNRRRIGQGWVLLASLAIAGCAAAYDRQSYAGREEWREFFSIMNDRIEFTDFGISSRIAVAPHVLKQGNWSDNDHSMICNWFYDDPAVFSAESLHKVVAGVRAEPLHRQLRPSVILYRVKPLADVFANVRMWLLLFWLPLPLCFIERERRMGVSLLAGAAVGLLLCGYLLLFKKLPDRVYYPLAAAWGLQAILLATSAMPTARQVDATVMHRFLLLALCGGGVSLASFAYHSQQASAGYAKLEADLSKLAELQGKLVVTWGSAFPSQHHIASRPWVFPSGFRFAPLGWTQRSPINERTKQAFGISNLCTGIYEQDTVLLMSQPRQNRLLEHYLRQHYGREVKFDVHTQTPSFTLYRVRDQHQDSQGQPVASVESRATSAAR